MSVLTSLEERLKFLTTCMEAYGKEVLTTCIRLQYRHRSWLVTRTKGGGVNIGHG